MEALSFYIVATLTVVTALLVILQANPLAAAISLVASFFGMAVLFVFLQAHFLAVMQILLYAGAIMVFFVFVIMLLNLESKKIRWREITGSRLIRGSAAAYLLGLFLFVLLEFGQQGHAVAEADGVEGTVRAVGLLLMSKYVVPFELTSVLLLVAIIGAVVMGKREL